MQRHVVLLVLGRVMVVLGSVLVMMSLGQPWVSARITTSIDGMDELRLSFDGGELISLAAGGGVVAAKVVEASDTLRTLLPGVDLDELDARLADVRQMLPTLYGGLVGLLATPIVTLVLGIVLLATHGAIRFRRVFGAVTLLGALALLTGLTGVWLRTERALETLQQGREARAFFDLLDSSGVGLRILTEPALAAAALFPLLIALGALAEVVLPLPSREAEGPARETRADADGVGVSPLHGMAGASQPVAGAVALAELSRGAPQVELVSAALEQQVCTGCGTPLARATRFCGGCGARQYEME